MGKRSYGRYLIEATFGRRRNGFIGIRGADSDSPYEARELPVVHSSYCVYVWSMEGRTWVFSDEVQLHNRKSYSAGSVPHI